MCPFLWLVLFFLRLPTAWSLIIASGCWLCAIKLSSFQRRKPESRDIDRACHPPYDRLANCRRCVHFTEDGGWLAEPIQLVGTCNIDGSGITNQDHPFECIHYYTGDGD